jgi:hypothetical protein
MSVPVRQRSWLFLVVATIFCFAAASQVRAADAKIYVLLWFDTEDYILPASDDAALRLADWLTREGIRGTFKVVGEKARTLERRQRTDVIASLKKHEIGYHSNFHSVQPTPAVYLSTLGWDEGVAEFDRRERPGYDDVKRIFGQTPSCYGQPGSSWAPQAYGAMRKWGMKIYLDAGQHLSVDDRPHYYGGILTLYKLAGLTRSGLTGPKDLQQAEERFTTLRDKLKADGGGIVSIIYHPCEFVHKEFWDGANFRNGANPPRQQWKLPKTKTAEESRVAYETFEAYVRFLKRFDDVQFITASEAGKLYRDRARGRGFTLAEIQAIAHAVSSDVTFQKREDYTLAASEVLALLNDYLCEKSAGRSPKALELRLTPFGPSNPVIPLKEAVTTDASQLVRTAVDVADYLEKHGRVPTTVWLGSIGVPPESYLEALARVVSEVTDGKPVPEKIEVRPAKLAAGRYVADDAPELWKWVIFPQGFRAPTLMELARRQAWTIKPAVLRSAQE